VSDMTKLNKNVISGGSNKTLVIAKWRTDLF